MKDFILISAIVLFLNACNSKNNETPINTTENCSLKNKLVEFNSTDYFISNMDIKYEFGDTIKIILTDTSYYPYDKLAYCRLRYLASQIYPCIDNKYKYVFITNNFVKYNIPNSIIYTTNDMRLNYNKFQEHSCLTKIDEFILKNFTSENLINFNFLIDQINSLGQGYNEKEIIDIIQGYAIEPKDSIDGYYRNRLRALGIYTKAVIPQDLNLLNSVFTICGEDTIIEGDARYLKLYKKRSEN